jgi:hypothetical protein
VATVRRIVEEHPGHDTMFYNVLQQAQRDRLRRAAVKEGQTARITKRIADDLDAGAQVQPPPGGQQDGPN